MYRNGVGNFKYYVGISSLAQAASREDRVCVLNILGGESRQVTPVGHAYSGGNVVFGTSPGRRGQVLETALGDIPVYNNVLEGLQDGHQFNCGVIYLPPSAARDGVAELIRVNPELKKIFVVTEKLSVHDSREIRAMGQQNGIDIFGGNSLGIADAWNRVRIGGALGGDNPAEALRKGSIALFSNSGNFTTTIATYLRMAGWGTTTLMSSGKDVYIQFAAPEFAFALANDARSKAAVLYSEPGGYYEFDAIFNKPVVACVVGRWKRKLTRAVGHAGALAGGDDDACAKERWFMEKFGVDRVFTPEDPVFSAKGAVVTNIAHIPAALTSVMRENGARPDFEPEGNLALKPWFRSSKGISLPAPLDISAVKALPPYDEQIAALDRQVGISLPRQNMRDSSGASQMDPVTQVTSLYGVSVLQASLHSFETNLCLALLHETGDENSAKLVSVAVGSEVNLHGQTTLAAAQAARDAGNAPNCVLSAAASIVGPRCVEAARSVVRNLIDVGISAGLQDAFDDTFDTALLCDDQTIRASFTSSETDLKAQALLNGLAQREAKSVFVRFLLSLDAPPSADAVLAAITTTLAWGPLMRKRVSRLTVENLPWWVRLMGTLIGASVDARRHKPGRFCGLEMDAIIGKHSLTEVACTSVLGSEPNEAQLSGFQTLVGLLLSNGPGAISAQGAKGAVSADGPENPDRVQLNKALIGFLTHAGYAHGGNGFEGVAFLIERFAGVKVVDPGDPNHELDLTAMATQFARQYGEERAQRKELGAQPANALPCINHPVFKGKPVNVDPREAFVRQRLEARGEYNIFHSYYRALVKALYDENVTRNVFAVNVDAIIASLLLKMMWSRYQEGSISDQALENAAFTVFLFGRMVGCAAEIDDHLNRGRNMDTRTPQSSVQFVA
jgi:succinyl-CoA synthetase alpha subunit